MPKLLIKNGYVLDNLDDKLKEVDILIENDKIIKIEKNILDDDAKIIDADKNLVMPGFINCHNHSGMGVFRGYSDDVSLNEWLTKKIWPIEDKINGEQVYYSTLISCIEMIKSGTTTFCDMYFLMDYTAKAVMDSGLRACLGRCVMSAEDSSDIKIKEAEKLYNDYNNVENITVNFTAHAPYTSNDVAIKECIKLCKKYNTTFHIHLDETKKEHDDILEKYGITPTKLLEKYGAFDVPVILAHCVWQDEQDIEILKNIKGGIVHNPISNCKLSSGIAPISKYIKNDINVCLGTDGLGSTNTLDMFEEMKLCAYLQKVNTYDPTSISAKQIFKMATINGAKTLNMNEIGIIDIGKKADIIIVDMKSQKTKPMFDNIYSHLVYSLNGNDVLTTIVNGKVLMEDRKLIYIDEKKVYEKIEKIKEELFNN